MNELQPKDPDDDDQIDLFRRRYRKKRKHITLSRELLSVLSFATGKREASEFVEQAVWSALVDEYGAEQVSAVIETAQETIDDDHRLTESRTAQYRLPR